MYRLTHSEQTVLLKSLSVLHAQPDLAGLPPRIIKSASLAVSSEIPAIDSFNLSDHYPEESWRDSALTHIYHHPNSLSLKESWVEHDESFSPKLYEALINYGSTHPLMGEFRRSGLLTPLKITDMITTRQFRRTALYNELFRRMGVDKQMIVGLAVSPTNTLTLSMTRHAKDFTERDRRLLAALRPHFILACRNALTLARLVSRLDDQQSEYLSAAGSAVITLGMDDQVLLMSDQVRNLLAKYFALRPRQDKALPAELRQWLKRHRIEDKHGVEALPAVPLEICVREARLRISLILNESAEQKLLLLDEECVATSKSVMSFFGLTRREEEVLGWVALGRTNPEIAQLCSVSVRTVEKHLERVFQKLGVETRTAAARAVYSVTKRY